MNINDVLHMPQYKFLYTEKRLNTNIVFLTFGGSYAYGTNIEGSDIDIRGCALNSAADLIGLTEFDQYIDSKTDTTVYSFNKLIKLLCACNPNVIEILGCRPEDYTMVSPVGRLLLDNKKIFLSKRAASAFGGYATAQLRRLQTYSAKEEIGQSQKADFIAKTILSKIDRLENNHNIPHECFTVVANEDSVTLKAGKHIEELRTISVGDLQGFLGEINGIIKSYDSLTGRNRRAQQKSDKQLNKHAMHLIRLYLMAFDILEKGEINTYRSQDRDYLLAIRNGKYQLEDGTFSKELFELVNQYEKRLEYDKNNSYLPDHPDMRQVQDLMMEVNRKVVTGNSIKIGGKENG